MSATRLVSVVALLLTACAAWESSTPSYTPPPADGPVPSHYAPPPPGDPRATPPGEPTPQAGLEVAIASVQMQEDCPDPVAKMAAPAEPSQSRELAAGARARPSGDGQGWDMGCTQSMVQLSITSEVAGKFVVTGVRVIDPASNKVAGPAAVRGPTLWNESGGYAAWDERTTPGRALKVSYKLGEPDFSRAAELVGPTFNTYMGPFVLEMDVVVDGVRRTVRSPVFSREPPHVMVT